MATLHDIAERVNLSPRTVARVLAGQNKERWPAAAARAEEIRRVAQELGYRPNVAARATATGRFNSIALVLGGHEEEGRLSRYQLFAFHDALRERKQQLAISRLSDTELSLPEFVPEILQRLSVDGLLLNYSSEFPPRLVDLMREHRVPMVWVNQPRDEDAVYLDEFEGGRRAAQMLIDAGHERIAYADFGSFEPPRGEHYSVRDRQAGYERAMMASGLEVLHWRDETPVGTMPGRRLAAAGRCLDEPARPTAVVCATNFTADPVFCMALARGLRVPEDLSLVSFGDSRVNEVGTRIATMTAPVHALADAAVEMLMGKIEAPREATASRKLQYKMDQGHTFAPPGGAKVTKQNDALSGAASGSQHAEAQAFFTPRGVNEEAT